MLGLYSALSLDPIRRNRALNNIVTTIPPSLFGQNLIEGFSEPLPLLLGTSLTLVASRNRPPARTSLTLRPIAGSARRDLTSSGSPARRNPVSMKIGTSLSPKAFFATSAATVLSTPPETAAMALPVLIVFSSRAVSTVRKLEGWNPWTATDNRSPLATWLGWPNLLFINCL